MANAKDVAAVIQSALDEIGVTGQLEVSMDGQEAKVSLGALNGDDVHVGVSVEEFDEEPAANKRPGRSLMQEGSGR